MELIVSESLSSSLYLLPLFFFLPSSLPSSIIFERDKLKLLYLIHVIWAIQNYTTKV